MTAAPPSGTPDAGSAPSSKPLLRVTAFSDFICPFCYIGHVRLLKLRARYDVRVHWCLVEIHPDNPPQGRPLSALGYPQEQWRQMMAALDEMAQTEGIVLAPRRFTTNSRRALLLAEAAKDKGAEAFYRLADALYRAYFCDALNIGDESVLRNLARESALSGDFVERAWSDPAIEGRLREHLLRARAVGVRGTPTFVIGGQMIAGAVPTERLIAAAAAAIGEGAAQARGGKE